MSYGNSGLSLETKFCRFEDAVEVGDTAEISGYASVFGASDQGNDVVQKGAYAASLKAIKDAGRSVKMLWQHDPCLLYTSPSPRDKRQSRMPSSA